MQECRHTSYTADSERSVIRTNRKNELEKLLIIFIVLENERLHFTGEENCDIFIVQGTNSVAQIVCGAADIQRIAFIGYDALQVLVAFADLLAARCDDNVIGRINLHTDDRHVVGLDEARACRCH